MSTVGPAAVRWLACALPLETGLLDAPVLGSLSEAEEGTLQVFVGGPAPLAERWTPLLSALGSPIHVGPLGAGASAKLVANATLVRHASRCSARSWRSPTGSASPETSRSRCWPRRRSPAPPSGADPRSRTVTIPERFALALARKDSELIIEAAREAGVDVRVLEAARAWLADAEEAGFGDRDYSTVLAKIIETD